MYFPASTPPALLSVATRAVLPAQPGMSLSTKITLMPLSTAFCSASCTFGLVGVITIAFTPWVPIDSIALISPSSSVPLVPCAKTSSTLLWSLFHVLAASTIVS